MTTTSKKLCKFLSIKKLSKFDYNINISKKNLYKAKNNLTKSELNYISKKLKKFIQW